MVRFTEPRQKFKLTLIDLLDRQWILRFEVDFDDSHLQGVPDLRIAQPLTLANRFGSIAAGIREIASAFRFRN